MKVFDSISIGCGGYPSSALTLDELLTFADNVRQHEGILVEDSHDHRSVVYNFIKAEDLSDHGNLQVRPDDPWMLAERNNAYKRKDGESVEDWKARVTAAVLKQGYIVRGGMPMLVGTLEIDGSILGFKVTGNSLKINGDATIYGVYPCKLEAEY